MGFGTRGTGWRGSGFFGNFIGQPGAVLNHVAQQGQAAIPLVTSGPPFHFPTSTLVYFQFVFAAITPILMLGSVLGRINFKAWLLFVPLWTTFIYTVNAFLIWGGGFWAQKGAVDYSGGYVIHLSAGVSGFVAAAVIGPRLARDREIDAPNNLLMVAAGAGLLWLGWNGFNGGDPYYAGADAAAAVLNTNLATAVAFLVWVVLGLRDRPEAVADRQRQRHDRRPRRDHARRRLRQRLRRDGDRRDRLDASSTSPTTTSAACGRSASVDDTLGVIYTHGIAGLIGGLLVGVFADSNMLVYLGLGKGTPNFAAAGSLHLLKMQFYAGLWVILFSAAGTFILLKLVGLAHPAADERVDMETGDLAVHGHEVYPSDVPSLGYAGSVPDPDAAAHARTGRRLRARLVGAAAPDRSGAAARAHDNRRDQWQRRSSSRTTERRTTPTRSRSGSCSRAPEARSRSRTCGTRRSRTPNGSGCPARGRGAARRTAPAGSATRTCRVTSC